MRHNPLHLIPPALAFTFALCCELRSNIVRDHYLSNFILAKKSTFAVLPCSDHKMFSIRYIQRRRLQVLATYIQPILTSRLTQCLYFSVVSCYCSVLSEKFHSRQNLIPLTFEKYVTNKTRNSNKHVIGQNKTS